MIVWSGAGLLAGLIPLIIFMLFKYALDAVMGEGFSATYSHYVQASAAFTSAIAVWFAGKKLNSGGEIYTDEKTGEEVLIKPNHSMFFIPMQWWSVIIVGYGIYVLTKIGG